MDALFVAINAKYIHTNNAVRLLDANSQYDTDYIEFTIKDTQAAIIKTLLDIHPKIIGFSTYIWNIDFIKALIHELRLTYDGVIILGGPEVSYDAEPFLNTLPVDLIVKGEGEAVIDAVIKHYLNGDKLPLHNIAYKSKNTIINQPIEEIHDLSKLKTPYYNDKDIGDFSKKIAYIESSRGCPYRCSYCLSSLEKSVRFFPKETVKKDLLYLMNHGVKTFKFLDRTFNASKHMLDILDFIITHHKESMVFQFEITGDILDESIVDYIHNNAPKHLFRFEIGIQSTHGVTNMLVDRKQNNERLFYIINKIREAGIIDMHLDLIAGLPKETLPLFKHTFNKVYLLGAKELQLGFLKFLRGTKIRNEHRKFGYVFNALAPYEIQKNNDLSERDINTIKAVEHMLNIFHNKGHFNGFVYEMITQYFTPFDFFHQLHTFIHDNNEKLLHYQLDELYTYLYKFLALNQVSDKDLFTLKITYLKHFKVKPKLFFNKVNDKNIKQVIFTHLTATTLHPLHDFYKHSIMVAHNDTYAVVLYKNNTAHLYTVKNPA
ncbi:MAG: DUF4080 domain-containing protein [Bacillota bacterium]